MDKQKTKVLLVDDEPNILVALEFLVKQAGYQVFKASNGEEALLAAQQQAPHIIILDVMMPGMDGFEVARKVRSLPELENARIIFLTAKGTPEDKSNGYANGGEVYLTKPFDNNELINTINEVVEFG
ncbi:response regulator transcription factor [Phaeodactylibacter luteus]|uniref:Response regulator n=1 Tax=Phaeodactylibacter luteus TaxID=1564516 RepID=A0A5C6S7Z8_9BACT|nr:response regulator [Phaeodactylibacter luteus]TXB70191.1 response regulator [Phaeodactylibacter luteus]